MCLVRSRQNDVGTQAIPGDQESMGSPHRTSQQEGSQRLAKNQQHSNNKHFPTSDFKPQPIQKSFATSVVSSKMSEPIPLPCKSKMRDSNTISSKKFTKNEKGKNQIIVVQHNYHDHSKEAEIDHHYQQKSRGGVSVPFPLKLHDMLDKAMADGHGDIVSWQPHGRCFVVYKAQDFQDIVLPKYFKLTKISSFQRQLNLYGFQRLTFGRDRGGYYHELFLRNKVFLARNIKRVQIKGTGVRARSNPDKEPNFWTMSWCEPEVKVGSNEIRNELVTAGGINAGGINAGGINAGGINHGMPPTLFASRQAQKNPSTSSLPILKMIQPIETRRLPNPSPLSGYCNAQTNHNMNIRQHGFFGGSPIGGAGEGNLVYSFGDKAFHYLDPFQPISLEENKIYATNETVSNDLYEHLLREFNPKK